MPLNCPSSPALERANGSEKRCRAQTATMGRQRPYQIARANIGLTITAKCLAVLIFRRGTACACSMMQRNLAISKQRWPVSRRRDAESGTRVSQKENRGGYKWRQYKLDDGY